MPRGDALHFIGNVEAHDLFRGDSDVVVCDGFTGNILLKTSESAVEMLRHMMREEFMRSWAGRLSAMLARGAFARLRRRVGYAEFGGAPLLGIRGLAVICHGRSNPRAIRNGIRVASEYAEAGVNRRIEEALAAMVWPAEQTGPPAEAGG